jgi:hypothetical protein
MSELIFILPFVVGLTALGAILVWVSRRMAAKRQAELDIVAQQAGWSFTPEPVEPLALGLGAFPLFTHGRAQRASNLMRGSDGPTAITVFDYRYTVGGGKHQTTIFQTVVHLRSMRLSLPPFVLSPENVLHKVGAMFGYHDIDFDSSPEFSQKYLLRGAESETQIRELFTPSVRAYLEQRAAVNVEGDSDQLLLYRHRHQVKHEELRAFVDEALSIARQFER